MRIILIICFLAAFINLPAQTKYQPDSSATKSINGIVNRMLFLISNEPGKPERQAEIKSLFAPNARLNVVGSSPSNTEPKLSSFTVDQFAEIFKGESYQTDFRESEISAIVEEYNGVAIVFQSYELKAAEIEDMGINTYQLAFYEDRWWIVNILWASDRNGVKVPKKYLK